MVNKAGSAHLTSSIRTNAYMRGQIVQVRAMQELKLYFLSWRCILLRCDRDVVATGDSQYRENHQTHCCRLLREAAGLMRSAGAPSYVAHRSGVPSLQEPATSKHVCTERHHRTHTRNRWATWPESLSCLVVLNCHVCCSKAFSGSADSRDFPWHLCLFMHPRPPWSHKETKWCKGHKGKKERQGISPPWCLCLSCRRLEVPVSIPFSGDPHAHSAKPSHQPYLQSFSCVQFIHRLMASRLCISNCGR